ncbi:NAD-dependent protein deacetylase [Derxia lacustris]|uniref:NAD-dependent protein deacetylase n=1 Tax=Derxia lacustris TaxID=764842 RepID=UPI000A174561|nr:NAD-dependent protein deacetylase [Derxia lacustris]
MTLASSELDRLLDRFARHPRWLVLTGAGISTESGIPDYRDAGGAWKRKPPVDFRDFMARPEVRARYWARSAIGWTLMRRAEPNVGHRALAALEVAGRLELLVTQNVDGLHQAAGSAAVVDLHGRIDTVVCMGCRERTPRAQLQARLVAANPDWLGLAAGIAPDGDADLDGHDFSRFAVPACERCGGVLKPDVVFYGENVPRERVDASYAALAAADALLVVGSSLMVFSGFRFARDAARAGKPVLAINLGVTRADDLLADKIALPCGAALAALAGAG